MPSRRKLPDARITFKRLLRGDARRYIRRFRVRAGDRFVIYCRVSFWTQYRNQNLLNQERWLRRAIEECGGQVIAVFHYVGPGKAFARKYNPTKLIRAAKIAKGAGATLIGLTTDRFVRALGYHSQQNPKAQASEDELEDLAILTDGVRLMTWLRPDAWPNECESCRSRVGQWAKGRKGGRPLGRKEFRRLERDWIVTSRRRNPRLGYLKLAILSGVPRSTVRNWCKTDGV